MSLCHIEYGICIYIQAQRTSTDTDTNTLKCAPKYQLPAKIINNKDKEKKQYTKTTTI